MSTPTGRQGRAAEAFPERSAHKRRRFVRLEPFLPSLEKRVQQGCEQANLLWQEIGERGYTQGYQPVTPWVRESLGKPSIFVMNGVEYCREMIEKRSADFQQLRQALAARMHEEIE